MSSCTTTHTQTHTHTHTHAHTHNFPNFRVPYFGVLIIRILLFRVLYQGPPIFGNPAMADIPWGYLESLIRGNKELEEQLGSPRLMFIPTVYVLGFRA